MLALAGWKASHALQGSPVFDGGVTPEQGQALYAAVKAGDVVMYSAVWCGTCQNTKAWMQQNNITFTECDIEASASCAREYRALGSGGVPTVVVRGKAMRPGFGSQEFIAMLKSCPRLERPRRDGVTTTAQAPDAVRRNGYRVMLRRAK